MGEYEDTLEEKDRLEEIYQERARYLVNTDELIYEMLDQIPGGLTEKSKMRPIRKAGTVCCGMMVDLDRASLAKTQTGIEFLICDSDKCRKLVEMATPEQIKELSVMNMHLSEIVASAP